MVDSEHWTLQHCSILRRAPHCTQLSRLLCSAKLNFMMHFARVKRHILSVVCNSAEPTFPFWLFLHLPSKQFHDFEVFLTLKGVVVNIFHPPGGGGLLSCVRHLTPLSLTAYTSLTPDQQLIRGVTGRHYQRWETQPSAATIFKFINDLRKLRTSSSASLSVCCWEDQIKKFLANNIYFGLSSPCRTRGPCRTTSAKSARRLVWCLEVWNVENTGGK